MSARSSQQRELPVIVDVAEILNLHGRPRVASGRKHTAIIRVWDNPVFGFFGLPVPIRQLPVNSLFPDLYDRTLARLVEARKRAGATQTQLAVKLGRPQSFVAKYEGRGPIRAAAVKAAASSPEQSPTRPPPFRNPAVVVRVIRS